jgi:hypothetical protein
MTMSRSDCAAAARIGGFFLLALCCLPITLGDSVCAGISERRRLRAGWQIPATFTQSCWLLMRLDAESPGAATGKALRDCR